MSAATNLLRGRQARWAVPVGAVAAVGIVVAGSVIARGQATPALPARTTAQLLAAVDNPAALPSAMTATVQETASLGLPDLPGSSDPLSGLSLLSGTHTFKIWYDGPAKVRVAVPVSMGETDVRRDGRNVWLWDSQTNKATHYILPAGAAGASAEHRHGAERPDAAADRKADPGRGGLHNHRRPSAERDRRGPARLPALAGAQGQPLADRAGQDRHRREQLASAAGAGLRARRGQSRVQRGLHLALVRQARRVQLRVLPAAGREGEDGHGPGRRAIRTVPACRTCPPAVFTPAARVPRRPARSFSG